MATPHVTGAVALYAAAYPAAAPADVRGAILNTARPTASVTGKTVTGGWLDVASALNASPPVGITITGGSVVEGNSAAISMAESVAPAKRR